MIKILVVGLPGDMATTFTKHALKESEFDIINFSIAGNYCDIEKYDVDDRCFQLIKSNDKTRIDKLFDEYKPKIIVDYTKPAAVEQNIDLYCSKETSFVMGTTGVVIDRISDKIIESDINAVISTNMGKQIVALQSMLKYAANNFPNCFKDYTLQVKESHQNNKLDTSGTARVMVGYFKQLGIDFDERDIEKIRNPKEQIKLGVPQKYLEGHGWHTYSLTSEDKTVHIEITHNINGRDIYAKGTIDSIFFLDDKINKGVCGKIFSMIDVLGK
ncbi:MAG: hypothetical protein LBC31_09585 [Treponema sp.]|jgi:4-hydroxy-tetrahydrodipicolinate reductase|nr:hypothetical protein [Treponema sp.]